MSLNLFSNIIQPTVDSEKTNSLCTAYYIALFFNKSIPASEAPYGLPEFEER